MIRQRKLIKMSFYGNCKVFDAQFRIYFKFENEHTLHIIYISTNDGTWKGCVLYTVFKLILAHNPYIYSRHNEGHCSHKVQLLFNYMSTCLYGSFTRFKHHFENSSILGTAIYTTGKKQFKKHCI